MWKYYNPVEVVFGTGKLDELGQLMAERGLDRALIVSDPFTHRSGVAARLKECAGGRVLDIISEVEPNPTCDNVDACARRARELGAGSIIGLGRRLRHGLRQGRGGCGRHGLHRPGAAAGEARHRCAAPHCRANHRRNRQRGGLGRGALRPRRQRQNRHFRQSHVPQAGPGGPGADLHCAPRRHRLHRPGRDRPQPGRHVLGPGQPGVRRPGRPAAKLAFENLEAAFRDGSDAVARERMAMASTIAGYAFSNTGTTGSHACSYLLTAKYHIPHGEACALTLDAWFRKDAAVRPLLHTLSRMMGFADANAAADRLAELKELTGMRTTLTAMGVPDTQEALDELAANAAASGNMANDICKATREDIASLFASLR